MTFDNLRIFLPQYYILVILLYTFFIVLTDFPMDGLQWIICIYVSTLLAIQLSVVNLVYRSPPSILPAVQSCNQETQSIPQFTIQDTCNWFFSTTKKSHGHLHKDGELPDKS